MATICPLLCHALTIRILCSGDTRAYTEMCSSLRSRSSSSIWSSSAPVAAMSPGVSMPIRSAIAMAVTLWSPVIITGRIPACLALATAERDSGLGGSIMAIRPRKIRSSSSAFFPASA